MITRIRFSLLTLLAAQMIVLVSVGLFVPKFRARQKAIDLTREIGGGIGAASEVSVSSPMPMIRRVVVPLDDVEPAELNELFVALADLPDLEMLFLSEIETVARHHSLLEELAMEQAEGALPERFESCQRALETLHQQFPDCEIVINYKHWHPRRRSARFPPSSIAERQQPAVTDENSDPPIDTRISD